MTIHLHPTAPLAERVLLPGDPGRALRLAQALLDSPRMFNHSRGLWGYTGTAPDGEPLSIQSTGMGGPSAAIVVTELAELGARRLVRTGTCGALEPAFALGELLVVSEALPRDGTSAALSAEDPLQPDPALLGSLQAAAGPAAHSGRIVSSDLFYDVPDGAEAGWVQAGARAIDMETATLFALGARHELQAGSLLVVSDLLASGRTRIDAGALEAAEIRMGEVALAALTTSEAASA